MSWYSPARPAETARSVRLDGNRIASVEPASGPTLPCWRCHPSPTPTTTPARSVRAHTARPASRWKPGCTISRCRRRSIPISPRGVAVVQRARRLRHRDGALHARPGPTDLPTEAKEVARAARDVGVRVGFAVAMRDRNPLVYGPSEPILDGIAGGCAGRDRRTVHPDAAAGHGSACAGRCGRGGGPWSDVRRAVWAEWRAMGDPGIA